MVYQWATGETVYEQEGCKGVRLYAAGGNEYVQLELAPGGAIPEHALPIAVSFCVLEGEGICSVDGLEEKVGSGEMVECPPELSRGWKNETDALLKVLVIKRIE